MMSTRFSNNGQKSAHPVVQGVDDNRIDLMLNRLNELWVATETKLITMQPPRPLFVPIETEHVGEDCEYERYHCLGLAKVAGRWRVCYGTYDNTFPLAVEPAEWKPILECSLDIRVKAAKYIDALRYEVHLTGQKFIPELNEAIKNLEEILKTVD